MKSLRPERAQRFAAKYVRNGFNPVQAVVDCGITRNRNSAHVIGWRLLQNVTTRQEIRKHLTKMISNDVMTAQEVLQRLSKHARASLADVLTDDGHFDLQTAKDNHSDDLLKKLKVRRLKDGSVEHEYEIHDPQNALVQMARVHKLLTDRVEQTNTSEQSHIVEQTILKRSERTGEDAESIALSLLESFQDEPEFLQPELWGKFAYVLAKPLESKEIQ